ncbi:MAG: glycosyltransferase, partial [Candidatus Binataceae bacterium]
GPSTGGVCKDVPGLCREMARRGWDVRLLATDGDGKDYLDVPLGAWLERDEFMVQYFRTVRLPGKWNSFALCDKYRQALRREVPKSDIVHIYSLYNYPGLVASYYARRSAAPYVLEPHGTLDSFSFGRHKWRKRLYEYLLEKRNFRNAAAIRFLSQAECTMASGNLAVSCKGVVIPTGIEPEEFRTSSRSTDVFRRYGIPPNRRVVAFVGRLHLKKGIDLLARAFIQLAEADSSVHLVVIGPDDGMEQKVRAMILQAGMNSRVTFTGMVTGQDKIDLMSAATVIVIPSYTENFCNVAIEAMALGVPLVVSSGVGIAEQIGKAGAGLVTEASVNAIKAAIESVINRREEAHRLLAAGRTLASESFSWTAVGAQIDALYRQVIAARAA